ncbi:NRAMP family divalent metal transporter [Caenimonas terrae]|uniref:NRAMP family divalent metal transporter n=1 Tax=Caenimonas terrae TaxID=696074 RepID=A0ABW0NJ16_9BURK
MPNGELIRSAPALEAPGPPKPQSWLRSLGPGLITGAADDDPSGIATYSQGGAQFGYTVAWTVLFTFPLMVGIQLASARIGRVTGRGLTENFARQFPRPVVHLLISLLVVANTINLGADINAMADAAHLITHCDPRWMAAGFGLLSLALQVFLPYARYVRILKWLTLALFSYIGVAFTAHVDWAAAAHDALMPHIVWSRDYATTIVAILGTTISPYLFFWQAAQEVEEIRRVPEDKPLRTAPEQVRAQLRRIKLDTYAGMGVSNLVAFFMIVAAAATLHAHGIVSIETTTQAAQALEPIAGRFAYLLFAIGIIGTGLLALPVLAGSAADAIASLRGWRKGLDQPPGRASAFYGVLAAAMLVGVAISLAGFNPIKALYWSAVINAVISVPIMVAVMLTASNMKLMSNIALHTKWKVLGWLATAAMLAATMVMGYTLLF